MEPKKIQKGKQWVDSEGVLVDSKRLFKEEKVSENNCVKIYNTAIKISDLLIELNELCSEGTGAYLLAKDCDLKAEDIEALSTTMYSFDKSVKVEKLAQKLPEYDKKKLEEARRLFDLWLKEIDADGSAPVLIGLIRSAFETKSGKFDKKKLDQLLEYDGKVESLNFAEAITILKEARNTDTLKVYYNIYSRDEEGKYQQINTRLSGVTNIN